MPVLTRWMVKTSLIYLLLAFIAGLAQAAARTFPLDGPLAVLSRLEPVRVHLFVVGWLTLLIFGVVHWMFPKYSRERPRGHDGLAWAAYWLLNVGLALRALFEGSAQPGAPAGWALVVSAVLQWLAGLAFLVNTWPRVKEK